MRTIPNFLIAGSGESGTSWLYACLLQHPQVYMPKEMRPEPHFFFKSQEYEKGFDYYLERYFSSVPRAAVAVGERSSSYMFGENAPQLICKHLPNVKIILMLREPVERAYSNWRFTVQSGLEWRSFESAIEWEERRLAREKNPFWREVQPYAYLSRSQYGEQVARFFRQFPKENILVLNSDTTKLNELATLRRVCKFLGIDSSFEFGNPGTFPTSSVRSRTVQYFLRRLYGRQFDELIEETRQGDSEFKCSILSRFVVGSNLCQDHPHLNSDTRKLLEDRLIESNRQLKNYVNWDPFHWNG